MRLVPVPPSLLIRVWGDLGEFIARACERPGCDETELSLLTACLDRRAQVIAIVDSLNRIVAAGVTQIREHADGRRSCWVLAIGGSRVNEWSDTLSQIEDGAAALGCKSVEFIGRRAWARVLPDYRATRCETGVHYQKDLP
jgi:hypothetical protein